MYESCTVVLLARRGPEEPNPCTSMRVYVAPCVAMTAMPGSFVAFLPSISTSVNVRFLYEVGGSDVLIV